MIVYDGIKTDFLTSCEKDTIAIEIEENILSKMGKHTPKAEFRSWENSLNYMYKVLNDGNIPSDAISIFFSIRHATDPKWAPMSSMIISDTARRGMLSSP